MKVVLLAGGLGSRLSEETDVRPKPMVEIGGRPILWHVMQIYSQHGFSDFVVCLGYKGHVIKEYFSNLFLHQSDVTVELLTGKMEVHNSQAFPWRVTLVDTGLDTMTGGRIARAAKYLNGETFMATYGDGVGDIDIRALLEFHRQHGRYATVTAVRPPARFGVVNVAADGTVVSFDEKPNQEGSWINGGFFVLEPEVFRYIENDQTIWERASLEKLAGDGQLMAYKHHGFWKPMDTLRDRRELEALWSSGAAQWAVPNTAIG
jgi:glucose-1-phosphate cytidylyltransferase